MLSVQGSGRGAAIVGNRQQMLLFDIELAKHAAQHMCITKQPTHCWQVKQISRSQQPDHSAGYFDPWPFIGQQSGQFYCTEAGFL
jgi:hypothetical protein